MSRPATSNFATGPHRQFAVARQPTQWDLILQALEITEHQAHLLFNKPEPKARRLKLWIMQNYRRCYIPLAFLTAEQQEIFSWE